MYVLRVYRLMLLINKLIVSSTFTCTSILSVLGVHHQIHSVHETWNSSAPRLKRTYGAEYHQSSTECRAFHSYEQPNVQKNQNLQKTN